VRKKGELQLFENLNQESQGNQKKGIWRGERKKKIFWEGEGRTDHPYGWKFSIRNVKRGTGGKRLREKGNLALPNPKKSELWESPAPPPDWGGGRVPAQKGGI